jgi:hypothetical protein
MKEVLHDGVDRSSNTMFYLVKDDFSKVDYEEA